MVLELNDSDIDFFKTVKKYLEESLHLYRVYDETFWSSKNKVKNYIIEPAPNHLNFQSFLIFNSSPNKKSCTWNTLFENQSNVNEPTYSNKKMKTSNNKCYYCR